MLIFQRFALDRQHHALGDILHVGDTGQMPDILPIHGLYQRITLE